MAKVFADIDISLDGFVAGEEISPENPLGLGGEALIWYGDDVNDINAELEGAYGEVDARVLQDTGKSEGAVIMGRRTFDVSIAAWGENPPIHKPCFVLSSQSSPPVEKAGGTSFVFVTGGPEEAVRLAKAAAGGLDVGLMGGAQTIRGFLASELLDELRLHIIPVLLGKGLRLFEAGSATNFEFQKVDVLNGERAIHVVLRPLRKGDGAEK